MPSVDDAIRASTLFKRLSHEDVHRLAAIALTRVFERGETLFSEGDPSDYLHTLVSGRVKIVKSLPDGREIILEIFGAGDPVGAVVAYEGLPYPATAVATERSTSLLVRRADFFDLLARHPSVVRGFLSGMALRIVELTRRIPEVAGGRVETRFARLFVKLSERFGQTSVDGRVFLPLHLTRQELADLTGTTIETSIRIMSRWHKEGSVQTRDDGFLVRSVDALEAIARG